MHFVNKDRKLYMFSRHLPLHQSQTLQSPKKNCKKEGALDVRNQKYFCLRIKITNKKKTIQKKKNVETGKRK